VGQRARPEDLDLAVLIPCYDEEQTIGRVVADFRLVFPAARVFVYDNNSKDRTVAVALAAGAEVRSERHQGKGNVVRRMFADIDADVYVMVDGDDQLDAACAPELVQALLDEGADMVTGVRKSEDGAGFRPGHRTGNRIMTRLVGSLFGHRVSDVFSGYRVLSRRYVKSFPALSAGFELETELSVHALELRMPIAERPAGFRDRPVGNPSKLHRVRDGLRILSTIVRLVQRERPLPFYGAIGGALATVSIVLALPVFWDFYLTSEVPRFPTAILCSAIMLLAFLSFTAGLILDAVTHHRRETRRLAYLAVPSILAELERRPVGATVKKGRSAAS
jgi:hypothetical protein